MPTYAQRREKVQGYVIVTTTAGAATITGETVPHIGSSLKRWGRRVPHLFPLGTKGRMAIQFGSSRTKGAARRAASNQLEVEANEESRSAVAFFLLLQAEGIKHPARAYIDAPIGNRRRGKAFVIQLVDR